MDYTASDQQEISRLPQVLQTDPLAVAYVLELKHSRENKQPHHTHKQHAHALEYNLGTPETVLGNELIQKMREGGVRERDIRYIARVLPRADIEVALKDEQIPITKYVHLARLRRLSPEEMLVYTTQYDPKPEHILDVRAVTKKWTQLERDILAWNMGYELGRSPSQPEIEDRLVKEVLSTGGSHSKRCRAFCYLAHPDWFEKKTEALVAAQ